MLSTLTRYAIPVLVFVGLSLFAVAADAQNAVIRGIVRDLAGEPLSEASVTAESGEWNRLEEARTDDSGRFSFIGLQAGRWLFVVRKLGFQPSQGFANVRRTGESGTIEFKLEFDPLHPPAPSTGMLAGLRADDIQANLDAAHDLFDRGDYDGAIAAYQSVLARIPQLTSLNLQIGHAYREKQDYDRAMTAYRAVPTESSAGLEAELAIRELATR